MLVIRNEQMEALRAAAQRAFEDEMVIHLSKFSPPLFRAIGEDQLLQAIRLGTARAGSYGLTYRGPVRLYLEMTMLFGSHFDTDAQYSWSAEILTDRNSGSQMQRAELLYQRTLDYRRKVAGPEDVYTLQALRNISALARQPLALSAENFVSVMVQEITRVYPQKAAYVGTEGLEALIRDGIDGAHRYHFTPVRGAALIIILMLAFGHGCANDPLYPWIARTLKDEAIIDPAARAKRLEAKSLTWLEHVLAYFDNGAQT